MAAKSKQRGSALLVIMTVSIVVAVLIVGLVGLSLSVGEESGKANARIARVYAAEAGLDRVKQLVTLYTSDTSDWLETNSTGTAVTFYEGGTSFKCGDSDVEIIVTKLTGGWYLVRSVATDTSGWQTTIAMTARPRSYFSDYARFVSDNNLSIGSNAAYDGKVHSNGSVNCNGSKITFYEDVTAHGSINSYYDTTFMKNATGKVPEIILPEASELEDLVKDPPEGAISYDWDNNDFRNNFKAATGYYPNNTLKTYITFDKNKMTVVNKCSVNGYWRTWTQNDVDVPDGNPICTRGKAYVDGNISRRTSIVSPTNVYLENSVRYVDDNGGAMWQLKDAGSGNPVGFSTSTNTWTPTDDWKNTSNYKYEMADDWSNRKPVDSDGNGFDPCLGVVSGATIYLTGSNTNREVHAALFTSGDVVRPDVGSTKRNLHVHGSIITTDTNPLSGSFYYRCYAYDPNLRNNPPPGFPTMISPNFRNWHLADEVGN